MSARYAIQTGLVFNAGQPEFLLIEYGAEGSGRCVGQFFSIADAVQGAHDRANERPHLTVIENPRKRAAPES